MFTAGPVTAVVITAVSTTGKVKVVGRNVSVTESQSTIVVIGMFEVLISINSIFK